MGFWITFGIIFLIAIIIFEIIYRRKKRKLNDQLYKDVEDYQESERLKRINGIKL